MGLTKKAIKLGIFSTSALVALIAMAFYFGLSFGKGMGLGDGPPPQPVTKTPPKLQPAIPFSFCFKNDVIFYRDRQISEAKFLELLQDANKMKERVLLLFIEESTTIGFMDKVKNTVNQLGLKYRIERIRPDGS